MRTHRIIHSGGVRMITIPREIWRAWAARGAALVRIEYEPHGLRVIPYTERLEPCYPTTPEEGPPANGRPARSS